MDDQKPQTIPQVGKTLSQLPANESNTNLQSGQQQNQVGNDSLMQNQVVGYPQGSSNGMTAQSMQANTNTYSQPVMDQDDEYEDDEREVVEKVVYKDKPKGFSLGFLNPFKLISNVKRLACLGCSTILVLFALLLITIIFRPSITWEPLKGFLNAGYNPPEVSTSSIDDVKDFIDNNIKNVDNNSIVLNESQATQILRSKVNQDAYVDIEDSKMRFIIDIDSQKEKPLWLIIEFTLDSEGVLDISKIGFERIGLPQSINKSAGDWAFKAMNLAQGNFKNKDAKNAFSFFSEGDDTAPVDLSKISFEDNQIVIEYN